MKRFFSVMTIIFFAALFMPCVAFADDPIESNASVQLLMGVEEPDDNRVEVLESVAQVDERTAEPDQDGVATQTKTVAFVSEEFSVSGGIIVSGDTVCDDSNGLDQSDEGERVSKDAVVYADSAQIGDPAQDIKDVENRKNDSGETQVLSTENKIGLEGFVDRLYRDVLQREPDQAGFEYQVNAMKNGLGAAQISKNFFCSQEFEECGHSNSEQVEIAYRTMLDRESDEEGKAFWLGYLDNGMSIASIVKGFSQAKEFISLCENWGVSCGSVEVTEARDKSPQITAFASRMYRIALGREADIDGLNCQCDALLKGTGGGQIARGFFLSKEFSQSGYSSIDAVKLVYRAMLDRDADQSGLEHWVAYLDNGMTADSILCGFNCSKEFGFLCGKWGISVNSMSPTLYRDRNFEVTKFVRGGYINFMARIPSGSELEYWCEKLLCGEGACEIMEKFVGSTEFTLRGLGNEESVRAVYGAMLERDGDAEGVRTWCGKLEEGKTLLFVVDSIADSEEFSALCSKMGVVRRVYLSDPYNGAFQGVSSSTPYFIVVDCNLHRVTIYEDKDGTWKAVQIWDCGDGASGMETVKGWFTVGIRGYYFDSGNDRCFYYTQFCGDYLFHSVLYAQTESPTYITDGRLGEAVSHGCVRLAVENARWIYENIPDDTTVYVF